MRIIIIAAGRGSRLEHHTQECPKCMVEVGGCSILKHQLNAYEANGVLHDLHIIRGYLAERLVVHGATYHLNSNWQNNNILCSLFCAADVFEGPLLTSYSDIVFDKDVVSCVLASTHDVTLVVDRDWARAYEGRDAHPVEQAELAEVDAQGRVLRVGKKIGPEHAFGEFIGLAMFSKEGALAALNLWHEVRATHTDEEPFGHAQMFRKAYLTDLINLMIERGIDVGVAPIDGGWCEIDTVQDLERHQSTMRRQCDELESQS